MKNGQVFTMGYDTWDGSETYSESSNFRMREMYSYNGVSVPPWAMQAFIKCAGNFLMSFVEAK